MPRGEALGNREDVYRLLVEQTRELLCLHDLDGRFAFLSPSVLPVLGYGPGDLVGTDPLALVHEDDAEEVGAGLRAVMEGRDVPVLVARFLRRNGTVVWLEVQARALRDAEGTATSLVTSSRDVSSRVELIRRVSAREATLASVISAFDDLVFVFDAKGRFREYHQPPGRGDLYVPPEEFIGRHFSEMLPDPVSEPLAIALEQARHTRSTQDFDYEIPIGGSERLFNARVTPMADEEGGIEGFVGVVRDVTERRALEEQKLALIRASEHAERLEGLSALARGAAHEFNNLLTTIQGNIELALGALEADSSVEEDLADALAASARAARITGRLLRYAGRSITPWEVLAPGEIARRAERGLRREPGEALDIEVAEDTPSFLGDAALVESALRRVLRNAFEALSGDGTRHVGVRVGARECGQETLARSRVPTRGEPGVFVEFEVTDAGHGIPAELQQRMFDPFFTTRDAGRGMGLAEVAGTVRSHDGAVLVDSRPGVGTRISLLFPARPQKP